MGGRQYAILQYKTRENVNGLEILIFLPCMAHVQSTFCPILMPCNGVSELLVKVISTETRRGEKIDMVRVNL